MDPTKREALNRWYWPQVLDVTSANKALSDAISMFYGLAAIQAVFGIFANSISAFIETLFLLALTFLLQKFRNIWAASTLFLWSLVTLFVTFQNRLYSSKDGGSNIFLAAIVVLAGLTAIRATSKLRKFQRKQTSSRDDIARENYNASPDSIPDNAAIRHDPLYPSAIGGWLILVGLGLLLGLLSTLFSIFSVLLPHFTSSAWQEMRNPLSPDYNPALASILVFELSGNFIALTLMIGAFFTFVKRLRTFPQIFISVQLYVLVFLLVDLSLTTNVLSLPIDQSDIKGILRSVIGCGIWIPYVLTSKRVKSTFTNSHSWIEKHWSLKKAFTAATVLLLTAQLGVQNKSRPVQVRTPVPTPTPSPSLSLDKEMSTQEIAALALQSLVVIEPLDSQGRKSGIGSGFFILPNVVVTNFHVVRNAKNLVIRPPNSRAPIQVRSVIGVDKLADLALLRTTDPYESFLSLGDHTRTKIGQKIFALGNPLGLEGSFSDGLISNKYRFEGTNYLQITAPISKGSSGGPLMDESGKVVGVATAFFKNGQNLSLAIPAAYISRLVARSEEFYPLFSNSELEGNPSINDLLPIVCESLVDVVLPDKYFAELSEKDLQKAGLDKGCGQAMPTCQRVWYNKATGGSVLIGSSKIDIKSASKLSRQQFDAQISRYIEESKDAYRKTNPESHFDVSQRDVNASVSKLEIKVAYKNDDVPTIDIRSIYFVMPFCRLEILTNTSGKGIAADEAISKLLTEHVVSQLPGTTSDKALFRFTQ